MQVQIWRGHCPPSVSRPAYPVLDPVRLRYFSSRPAFCVSGTGRGLHLSQGRNRKWVSAGEEPTVKYERKEENGTPRVALVVPGRRRVPRGRRGPGWAPWSRAPVRTGRPAGIKTTDKQWTAPEVAGTRRTLRNNATFPPFLFDCASFSDRPCTYTATGTRVSRREGVPCFRRQRRPFISRTS